MKGKAMFMVILILLLFPTVLSECNSSQIDINSASKEKLDEIDNIGPATAERIIESRPFNSLDELINVKYIGDTKLNEIKKQGLACVSGSEEENTEKNPENETKNNTETPDYKEEEDYGFQETSNKEEDNQEKPLEPEVIKLSPVNSESKEKKDEESKDPKTIKNLISFNIKENKSRYANYGLVAVTLVVIGSMLIKYRKNKYKNEFRE